MLIHVYHGKWTLLRNFFLFKFVDQLTNIIHTQNIVFIVSFPTSMYCHKQMYYIYIYVIISILHEWNE